MAWTQDLLSPVLNTWLLKPSLPSHRAVLRGPSHQGSHPNKRLPAGATPNRTLPWRRGLQLPLHTAHGTKCGHQMLYPPHPLPRAAGMNYPKLCCLTCWRGKSQRLSLGAAGLHSFLEALPARIPDSSPCQLREATLSPWLMAPSPLFKASDVPSHITSLGPPPWPPSSTFKDPWDDTGPIGNARTISHSNVGLQSTTA